MFVTRCQLASALVVALRKLIGALGPDGADEAFLVAFARGSAVAS
jgi:hypothetical protein